MRCDCCGDATHKNDVIEEHDIYRVCVQCWSDLTGDLNTIDQEIAEIRKQRASTPQNIILKNNRLFTKQFMPKFVSGISSVKVSNGHITVTGNCKLHYVPLKGKHTEVEINHDDYETWKNNLKLFKFIQNV